LCKPLERGCALLPSACPFCCKPRPVLVPVSYKEKSTQARSYRDSPAHKYLSPLRSGDGSAKIHRKLQSLIPNVPVAMQQQPKPQKQLPLSARRTIPRVASSWSCCSGSEVVATEEQSCGREGSQVRVLRSRSRSGSRGREEAWATGLTLKSFHCLVM